MTSFRAFIAGLIFALALLLLLGAAVHMIIGVNDVIQAVLVRDLSYIAAITAVVIMAALSGFKVAVSVKAMKVSHKFPEG